MAVLLERGAEAEAEEEVMRSGNRGGRDEVGPSPGLRARGLVLSSVRVRVEAGSSRSTYSSATETDPSM